MHILLEVRAGFPPLLLSALFVTNCSEALIAAGGVRLLSDAPTRFDTFRRVAAFIGCAALAAPILSSFADAAVAHWMSGQPYWTVWRMRTFANVLTELSIVPLFVIVASGAPLATRKRPVEATLLALGLMATAVWVFGDSSQLGGALAIPQTPPVLMLPFFFWAAVRFGVMGVSAALLIVAAVLSYEAGIGHQPFPPLDPTSGCDRGAALPGPDRHASHAGGGTARGAPAGRQPIWRLGCALKACSPRSRRPA